MMSTRGGGGAAAAPWWFFSRIVPAPVGLAVEVVLDGGSWPWVALVGMEGLGGLGRAKGAGTGAALPKAGGCRRRTMSRTVASCAACRRFENEGKLDNHLY